MPAGAASRYALGAGGVGATRPAPAASLISASRYALGARRTALRAEGAARLCAGRRTQPLAAIAASRYALRGAEMACSRREERAVPSPKGLCHQNINVLY